MVPFEQSEFVLVGFVLVVLSYMSSRYLRQELPITAMYFTVEFLKITSHASFVLCNKFFGTVA
jgi:hypothetical protein